MIPVEPMIYHPRVGGMLNKESGASRVLREAFLLAFECGEVRACYGIGFREGGGLVAGLERYREGGGRGGE